MEKEAKKITMEDLGYGPFFESNRKKLGLDGFLIARVISQQRGAYRIRNTNGEYSAKITGKIMFRAVSKEDYPAVGDWVVVSEAGEGQAVIRGILPRKTIIKRKFGDKNRQGEKSEAQVIATNIDVAFIVESIGRDYNLNRFERYLAIAKDGGIEPVLILNKIDLLDKEELNLKLDEIKNRFEGVKIIPTSTVANEGIEELKKNISASKTYCFLGSSGVGKSSIINILLGKNSIETGDISGYSDRGKHVTTSREMYFLDSGGIVIDNPGVREVGMTNMNAGIDNLFDEIITTAKKCKYNDCTHTHEPGCAVLASIESGELNEEKYSNYINIKKEAQHYGASKAEKRQKDKQFGKFINNVKKELRDVEHKDF